MSAFTPLDFETLLGWALAGLARERSVFGLPQRSFWRGRDGFDLSVPVPGGRADTPLGPAAGPHTQLAQNIVVAWLAGARVIELKTVQVLDQLEIPRPCIDAPAEAYNVEWSQELRLEESLAQYVAAWHLVHALAARGLAGEAVARAVGEGAGLAGTHFDASVGYDLAGVRSAAVAAFLDGLTDASGALAAHRARLPDALRAAAEVTVPARVVNTVTISTFHGCPAEEIEAIVEHLFDRHRLHVVVKLNPTLLGFDAVAHQLHDVLGRRDIVLDRAAFDRDLQWDHAVALLDRLAGAARRRGLTLCVKLTNTLVVCNTRGRLAGERVYLSGAPLHPLAILLAERIAASNVGTLPRSFSAGVNAENFADTVACGFAPVTTCTDLLQPTGYRRLPRYLKALEAEMERTGTRNVKDYAVARAHESARSPADAGEKSPVDAGVRSAVDASAGGTPTDSTHSLDAPRVQLAAYAVRLASDAGAAPDTSIAPGATFTTAGVPDSRPALRFLDCDACNRCVLVCPNAAFFSVALAPRRLETATLVVADGGLVRRAATFETRCESQWVVDSGLCNACGNCDTFCPEAGGPYRVKPRLHRSRAGYVAAAPEDGVLIERGGDRVTARFAGIEHHLERRGEQWVFGNDALEAVLDQNGALVESRAVAARAGHALELARFHALRALTEAVLGEVNPISAALAER